MFCKKQRLLEAIYDKVPEDNPNLNGHFSMDEYKYLKTRQNAILHNDPALSQVLQSLINAETSAKLEIKLDYFDDLLVKKLKQRLAFALIFMANRNRIQLDHNLTKIDQNDFLQKLAKFLHQSKQCDKKKFGQNCAIYCNNGNNQNYSKGKRFLQFVAKSLEIDWNATAPSNRQKAKRRKRRTSIARLILYGLFGLLGVLLLFVLFVLCGTLIFFTLGSVTNSTNQTIVAARMPPIANTYYDAFKEIPLIYTNENSECAICLGPIDIGTQIRPLPSCEHIFHNNCIEVWLQGMHNTCPICRQEIIQLSAARPQNQNGVENQLNISSSANIRDDSSTESVDVNQIEQETAPAHQSENDQITENRPISYPGP
uniref:RING-type domain-containing protein n=1 Tax=Globodera rostochiensis TaxID=31243 RepID=A0A914I1K8_GLORO